MRERCQKPNHVGYPKYGGRGITVCDRWQTFENFYADMGDRPTPKHQLDRIDNNGNYELDNCRWATLAEQAQNKGNNRLISFTGKTVTLAEWATLTGIHRTTLSTRLRSGWTVERALTTPPR